MSSSIRCKACGGRVVFKSADGVKCRIDGPLTFKANGACVGRCHGCSAEVTLPLELSKSFQLPEERFVVVENVARQKKNS